MKHVIIAALIAATLAGCNETTGREGWQIARSLDTGDSYGPGGKRYDAYGGEGAKRVLQRDTQRAPTTPN